MDPPNPTPPRRRWRPSRLIVVMGVMTVFLMGDVWRRDENVDAERPMVLFVLMLLLLLALTVTHHLSLFFVIIVLGLASLLRSLLTNVSTTKT